MTYNTNSLIQHLVCRCWAAGNRLEQQKTKDVVGFAMRRMRSKARIVVVDWNSAGRRLEVRSPTPRNTQGTAVAAVVTRLSGKVVAVGAAVPQRVVCRSPGAAGNFCGDLRGWDSAGFFRLPDWTMNFGWRLFSCFSTGQLK